MEDEGVRKLEMKMEASASISQVASMCVDG